MTDVVQDAYSFQQKLTHTPQPCSRMKENVWQAMRCPVTQRWDGSLPAPGIREAVIKEVDFVLKGVDIWVEGSCSYRRQHTPQGGSNC